MVSTHLNPLASTHHTQACAQPHTIGVTSKHMTQHHDNKEHTQQFTAIQSTEVSYLASSQLPTEEVKEDDKDEENEEDESDSSEVPFPLAQQLPAQPKEIFTPEQIRKKEEKQKEMEKSKALRSSLKGISWEHVPDTDICIIINSVFCNKEVTSVNPSYLPANVRLKRIDGLEFIEAGTFQPTSTAMKYHNMHSKTKRHISSQIGRNSGGIAVVLVDKIIQTPKKGSNGKEFNQPRRLGDLFLLPKSTQFDWKSASGPMSLELLAK